MKRWIQAIAGAVIVGLIMQESLWLGLNAVLSGQPLNHALAGLAPGTNWLAPALAAWILGGLVTGVMATLIGGHRIFAWAGGLLLGGSAAMLMHFSPGGPVSLSLTPVLAAALAGLTIDRLMRTVHQSEADVES